MDLAAFKDYVRANQTGGTDTVTIEKKLPKVQAVETAKEKWDSLATTSSKSLKKQSTTRRNSSSESKRLVKWEKNSRTKRKYSSKSLSHEDSPTVVSSVLRFSKSQLGNVLGTNGKSLIAVESKTGAGIKAKVREEEIKVTISGTKESVTRAESMIKSFAQEKSASTPLLPPVDPPLEISHSSGHWEKVNKRRRTRTRKSQRDIREKEERHRSPEGQRRSRPDDHLRREDKRDRVIRRPPNFDLSRMREQVVFNPSSPLGFALGENSRVVIEVIAGGAAACKGVQRGWEILRVGGIVVTNGNVRSILAFAVKEKKKVSYLF